jgi:hypothetical protein
MRLEFLATLAAACFGLFLFAGGCAQQQPIPAPVAPPPPPVKGFCDIAQPIYLDKRDRMTPRTADAIVAHNTRGEALCAWKRAK